MDPRLLLGVEATAGRAEVERAASRLVAKLDPDVPGATELRRLVRASRDVVNGRAPASALTVDPHKVLGLEPRAGVEENTNQAKVAFRRLARLSHPDQGGTDELFRVVEAAYELVVHPLARRTRVPWERTYQPPPGPPPPPGPFIARPVDHRHRPSKSRAALVVAIGSAAFVVATVASFFIFRALGMFGVPPVLLLAGAVFTLVSSGSAPFLRSVVVLVGTRVDEASASHPDRFLEACCLDTPVGREHEDVLYRAYQSWCEARRATAISPWRFVEHLRSLGLLYVRSSAWESGVWVGVRRRDA